MHPSARALTKFEGRGELPGLNTTVDRPVADPVSRPDFLQGQKTLVNNLLHHTVFIHCHPENLLEKAKNVKHRPRALRAGLQGGLRQP